MGENWNLVRAMLLQEALFLFCHELLCELEYEIIKKTEVGSS